MTAFAREASSVRAGLQEAVAGARARRAMLTAALFFATPLAEAAETAAFLKIVPGPRPVAMGGAFTGVADDLNSLSINPAGLSRMHARQAGFMHAELFAGARYDFIAFGQPVERGPLAGGALGFGIQRLGQGKIEGRDDDRKNTGSFEASDTAYSAAYSRRLPFGGLNGGVQFKMIESKIADATARTGALDLGLQKGLSAKGLPLSIGAAVRNLGPGLRFESETNELPTIVSVGAGVRLAGSMMLAADVAHRPNAQRWTFGLGTEYALLPAFSLRGGYASSTQSGGGPSTALGGLGMGFGIKIHKATLDYSFTPAGELGNAQRLAFTARF